ncbi:hypothetical protein V6N12_024725 [Hibiscus sabdariffa]|uniref:Uncharacterized protein n=1 Tax=Hibiscus sabdariffa TaxID=183260 RepID=A0ABR2BF28_9ROSI
MPRKLDHVTNYLFLPVQGYQIKSPFLPPLLRAEDVEYESNAPNLRYASEDHEYFVDAPNCEITPFSQAPLRKIS